MVLNELSFRLEYIFIAKYVIIDILQQITSNIGYKNIDNYRLYRFSLLYHPLQINRKKVMARKKIV